MAQAAIRTATWNGPGGGDRHLLDGQGLPEGPADGGAHVHGSGNGRPRELTVRAPVRKHEMRAPRAPEVSRRAATSPCRARWRFRHDPLAPSPPSSSLRWRRRCARPRPGGGLTLDQVERKYPRMSPVHIQKCDHDGDGIYTRTELLCVSGIYQAMYLDRD